MTSEPSIEEIQQGNGKAESFEGEMISDRICEEMISDNVLQIFDEGLQKHYISTNTYTITHIIDYKKLIWYLINRTILSQSILLFTRIKSRLFLFSVLRV
jgi:hypothetical protein